MLQALLVICILLSLGYYVFVQPTAWRTGNRGPLQVPFMGTFPWFAYNRYFLKLTPLQLRDRAVSLYGTTMWAWSFGRGVILTHDPKNVTHIHKNIDIYKVGPMRQPYLGDLLGDGIFGADDAIWQKQRKVASNLFKVRVMKEGSLPAFNQKLDVLIGIYERAALSGEELDASKLFYNFTLDSINKIAFGIETENLLEEHPFVGAFVEAQTIGLERTRNPFWKFSSYLVRNPPLESVDRFVYGIIEARRKEDFQGMEDLLSRFMKLTDEETNLPFSDKYLRDILVSFLIAGRDTTGGLLSFCLVELLRHPGDLNALLLEIDSTYEGRLPTYQELKQQTYLRAVIEETLRLWPPVATMIKAATRDDILPTGHKVPKGTMVGWSAYSMGRDPANWEKPTEWLPSRWLSPSGEIVPVDVDVFQPFQSGPRICLGQQLAYLETKIALVRLLQNFDFQLSPRFKFEPTSVITIGLISPLWVTAKKRTQFAY